MTQPTITLLTETLTDLYKKKKYHNDALEVLEVQIKSHEEVIKIIEQCNTNG